MSQRTLTNFLPSLSSTATLMDVALRRCALMDRRTASAKLKIKGAGFHQDPLQDPPRSTKIHFKIHQDPNQDPPRSSKIHVKIHVKIHQDPPRSISRSSKIRFKIHFKIHQDPRQDPPRSTSRSTKIHVKIHQDPPRRRF
jgi:hypothetical protein